MGKHSGGREVTDAEWVAHETRAPTGLVWAVVTTGIHCRDGCPARPLRRNLRAFPSRAAAEAAGFAPASAAAGVVDGPLWRAQTLPMRPEAILESALYAADLDAARAFYGGLLGLEEIGHQPGRHIFFRVGAGILLIFNPAATEISDPSARFPIPAHGARGPGHLCLAASRDEIARWRSHLTAAGVAIDAEFDWPGGARSLYFRDPAGNSLEFAEPRLWAW